MIFSLSDKPRKVPTSASCRTELLGQSRSPRLVFDARLVELFVVRSAGEDDVAPRVDRDCRHASRKLR